MVCFKTFWLFWLAVWFKEICVYFVFHLVWSSQWLFCSCVLRLMVLHCMFPKKVVVNNCMCISYGILFFFVDSNLRKRKMNWHSGTWWWISIRSTKTSFLREKNSPFQTWCIGLHCCLWQEYRIMDYCINDYNVQMWYKILVYLFYLRVVYIIFIISYSNLWSFILVTNSACFGNLNFAFQSLMKHNAVHLLALHEI